MKKNLLFFLLLSLSKIAFSQDLHKATDSLILVLKTSKEDTSKVNVLNTLSRNFRDRDNYNEAFRYANNALTLSQKIDFKKGICMAYNSIGAAYARQGVYDSALKNYSTALKICEEIKFKPGIVAINSNIGNAYTLQKNYALALNYYSENLKIGKETHNKKVMGNTFLVIGSVYTSQDNYPDAMKNDLDALKMFEEIGDKEGKADAYNSIGVIYAGQDNHPEAMKNYKISLKAAEEINYKEAIAHAHNNMAVIYSEEGNYNECIKHQLEALKIHQQLEHPRSVIISYNNLAEYYIKLKEDAEAKKYIDKSLILAKEIGDNKSIALVYSTYGELYTNILNLTEAKKYLKKALELAKTTGFNDLLRNCYEDLSKLDSTSGDYKGAYQYLQLYSRKKDSILNEESNKLVSQLNIQYETEKKDKDILLLNKTDEIKTLRIEEQKAIIGYLVGGFLLVVIFALIYFRLYNQKRKSKFRHQLLETEMKALRSQMNPHFTFNVLNSIQYFVSERDMESAEIYLEKFSTLIRMILDQSRAAYINFEQEITMLKLYLELEEMRFEKKFDYAIKIGDNINPDKILIPGMLIQPIVENAIKHGIEHKEGKALISISFSLEKEILLCTVTDNGIGRVEAEKFNGAKAHKSVATSIIRERMDALSSIYNIRLSYKTEDLMSDNGKPEGTRVSMEIPIGIRTEEFSAS